MMDRIFEHESERIAEQLGAAVGAICDAALAKCPCCDGQGRLWVTQDAAEWCHVCGGYGVVEAENEGGNR